MKKIVFTILLTFILVYTFGQTAQKVRQDFSGYADSSGVADTAKTLQGLDTNAIHSRIGDSTSFYTSGDNIYPKADRTVVFDSTYTDSGYINYAAFGNSTNLITGVLWMGDKNLDSSEINNLEADVAKITDTLGIQSDDGIFTFWNTAGTAKYSWYLDTDTFSFYNHADAAIQTKFYPNGETEFFDTVRAVEFYSTGSSVILSDYVFGDDYELLSWNKQVAYWQEHSALPSLHGKEIGKKGVQLGALAARTEGLVEEVEKLYLYMEQEKEENKKQKSLYVIVIGILIGLVIVLLKKIPINK